MERGGHRFQQYVLYHPYTFLFQDQLDYIRQIHKALTDKRHLLLETSPNCEVRMTLAMSYFLAYLSHPYSEYKHINYLFKSKSLAYKAFEILKKLIEHRQMQDHNFKVNVTLFGEKQTNPNDQRIDDDYNLIDLGLNIILNTSTIAIDSQQRFLSSKIRTDIEGSHSQKTNGHNNLFGASESGDENFETFNNHNQDTPDGYINFFEQIISLDTLCNNLFSRELTDRIVRKALRELSMLEKMECFQAVQPTTLEEEFRILVERLKERRFNDTTTQYLYKDNRLLNNIRYVLNYFKYRHRKIQKRKPPAANLLTAPVSVSEIRKLDQFVKEMVAETVQTQETLKQMKIYFQKMVQNYKIEQSKVKAISYTLEFVSSCIRFYQHYEFKARGAFRVVYPSKTDLDTFLFKLVCFQPKIIFDYFIYPINLGLHPNPAGSLDKTLLIFTTAGPVQQIILNRNFKLYFDSEASQISVRPTHHNEKTYLTRRKINSRQITFNNILALNVTCNAFEVDLKSSDDPEIEHYKQIQWNFGLMLDEFCDYVTDGIVVYVSSETYMHSLLKEWQKQNILTRIRSKKLVFVQDQTEQQNRVNLESFKKACDLGRGAIFILNARSNAAEVMEFDHHYSNLVYFVGYPILASSVSEEATATTASITANISTPAQSQNPTFLPMGALLNSLAQVQEAVNQRKPFQLIQYALARENIEYLQSKSDGDKSRSEDQFAYLENDAMRHVNKCLINCVGHSRYQRKVVVFADSRFNVNIVPDWLEVKFGNLNISQTAEKIREFIKGEDQQQLNLIIKKTIRRVTG